MPRGSSVRLIERMTSSPLPCSRSIRCARRTPTRSPLAPPLSKAPRDVVAPLPEPPRLALCDGLAAGGFTDAPGAPLLSRRLLSKALESQIEGRCPGSTVASGALAIIQQGG